MSTQLQGSLIIDGSLHNRCGIILPPTKVHILRRSQIIICLKPASAGIRSRGCGSIPKAISERDQNSSKFQPDIWGDRFLNYTTGEDDDITRAHKEAEIEHLKKQVRIQLVAAAPEDTAACLKLIDNLQRLGLSYHFENEIEEILKHVYETSSVRDNHDDDDDDLYNVSLRFRLLRQQGLDASSDVFNKFTDVDGKFKESLIGDIRGMLSLYEAANLGKPQGDELLDQALAFTITHLSSVAANSSENINSIIINDALKLPLLKKLPRIETRHYIPIYEQDVLHDKDLLKLAKLDFNLLQSLHKQELSDLVRWWKELDTGKKFPHARSRMVELYLWSNGVRFEPRYRLARNILAKVNAVVALIDDTFDSYATYQELQLLTEAVERWNLDCLDQLPEKLKPLYQLLLNTCNEIEQDLATQEGQSSHHIHYVKTGIKGFVRAHLQAEKWLKEGHVPTMDEYMCNGTVTSGSHYMPITFIVSMENLQITKEALEWVENDNTIIAAGAYITRLMNDIASHKREHIPTSVEVYMKQYNASQKEAVKELCVQVDKAWKVHIQEIIHKTVTLTLLSVILNMSRAAALFYLDGEDGYDNASHRLQEVIRLLFIDPVAM